MGAQVQFFDGRRHCVLLLGGEPLVVGGRHGAIKVPGATVSRTHARFHRDSGRFWIEDLGGDGVWVNGTRVERRALANRDKVRVGALELDYYES